MVKRLQGLLGLECAMVSITVLPPPDSATRSEEPSAVASVVPSGRTTMEDAFGVERDGRGETWA
jgi:hypothetical protein